MYDFFSGNLVSRFFCGFFSADNIFFWSDFFFFFFLGGGVENSLQILYFLGGDVSSDISLVEISLQIFFGRDSSELFW